MSANYWNSTQRKHWLFTKAQLAQMRQKLEDDNSDLVHMFPLQQVRHLYSYLNQLITRLGKRLKIRQQAMATAQVYIKRFYTRVEIRRTNPYLTMATAVYLACKMEECPQHIRVIVGEARQLWPDFFPHAFDASRLGECEFFLISEMSSQLIVHQPYRTLVALQKELPLSADDYGAACGVVNDSFTTDLPLLFPPHVIGLVAILLSLVLRPTAGSGSVAAQIASAGGGIGGMNQTLMALGVNTNPAAAAPLHQGQQGQGEDRVYGKVSRFSTWLATSEVDIAAMVDCTQEIISFYACADEYNDKITREQVNRFVKARGLDK